MVLAILNEKRRIGLEGIIFNKNTFDFIFMQLYTDLNKHNRGWR